jgi:hypothetical protein
MKGATTGEAARRSEVMDLTTPLVDRRTSTKVVAKTPAKTSVEESWQGMITPDPAFYLKAGA